MTDLPAWLAASHAAANPRPAYSAFTERRRPRIPMRAPTTPAPRYEDLQPLQDQFFQQRTEDASRRLMDGPLRRLDASQAQYAPDPIHTPLERGVIDTSRMVLPGAYDAGNAMGRISRGEDAWGDLATNTAFAALPFLGVRGARGEPAPLPMREPFPDFGRPPAESPQASSGTGDARSPDLTPANGPIRSTPNMTPERLSQLMSRTRDLEDHTPLDIRIRIDRARQERQMQQAMAGIENWTPQQVAHFHSLIERMDPVAAERFKDVLSRRIAELRTQGLFDDFGAELRSRASPDASHARPVQASDGNAASGGGATPFYDAFNNQTNAGLPPIPNFTPRLGANDRGALNRTRAALTGDEGLAFGQAYQYPARLDAPRNPAGVARTDRDPNLGFAANDDEFHYGTANPLPLAEVTPEPVPTGLKIEHQGSNWRIVDYGNLTSDGRPQTVRVLPTGSGFRDAREAFLEIRVRRGEAPTADIHALQSPNANGARPPFRSSRISAINRLPQQPVRPFEADYPDGASADDAGRLTHDIEGRPLIATRVVGRRMVQGPDEALSGEGAAGLAADLTGRDIARISGGTDLGRSYSPGATGHGWEIALAPGMTPAQTQEVLRHEIGHVIDEIAGQIDTRGIHRELTRVYDAGLSGRLREQGFTGPGRVGYGPDDAPRELIAETIRAYFNDPNALKTIAPRAAERIRLAVNAHPKLSRFVQFNALSLALGGAADAALDSDTHADRLRQSPNADAPPPPDRTPKSLPRRKPPNGGFSMFGAPR